MFESATLTAAPASTRLWSTCAGVSGQALLVAAMLLAPLLSPAVLPNLRNAITLAPPGPPPPPPPPGVATVRPRPVAIRTFCPLCMPTRVPDRPAAIIVDPPEVADSGPGVPGGMLGGSDGGARGGILTSLLSQVAAPPPQTRIVERVVTKDTTPPPVERVRAGGLVKLAAPVFHPDPVYPKIAIRGRIEGVVELEGIIGTDGRIHDLRVLKGHPFLVKAATDAVMTWRYTPATLNGNLVEVIAPITVTFRLGSR